MAHQIGSYILTEQIAVSDVGTVWRGYDRGGGGPVQVKVGEPRVAQLRISLNELREQGVSGLVSIRDCFVSEDGAPVLVTAPPQGRRIIDAYPSYDGAPRQVAHFIREAAITLKMLHDVGMTHGDISERTVWIDESDLPALAECGMGIRMDANPTSEPPRAGAEGREREFKLNQRADLFALGTVMYRMLSGEQATDRPLAEMSNPHASVDDIAPVDRVAPESPTELRAICSQLLATDPVHRYLDADSLIRDLESYLHGKRSKPAVKLGLVLAGIVLVGLFGIWGVTSGGPARILDVSLEVRRADEPNATYKDLALADHAMRVGDELRLNVILSKPSELAVYYHAPNGILQQWDLEAASSNGGQKLTIPIDAASRGWKVPSPGGVGVFIIVSTDNVESLESIVQLELMSVGQPPKTYVPITWRGKNIQRTLPLIEPINIGADAKKERWKSFEPYADQLIKNIGATADDVVVGWVYVIGTP